MWGIWGHMVPQIHTMWDFQRLGTHRLLILQSAYKLLASCYAICYKCLAWSLSSQLFLSWLDFQVKYILHIRAPNPSSQYYSRKNRKLTLSAHGCLLAPWPGGGAGYLRVSDQEIPGVTGEGGRAPGGGATPGYLSVRGGSERGTGGG